MGIGVNKLKQGTSTIALSDNGLETKVFYAADNAYGTNNGKVFDVNLVGDNSLPWFVSGSGGYITWDITASYQQWSGSAISGVTLSGIVVDSTSGDELVNADLSASFDSQNLTGASQSYNLDIKAGDETVIDNSYFVHDQAVEANYTRYDFSELATYQPYSLDPSYVQAVSASLIYPVGTNFSVDQNLVGKTKDNLSVDNYSNITSSMNGRLVLDMDGESPLYKDPSAITSTILLATGSVFIVFNNPAPAFGAFLCVGREDLGSTSNWYYINYNNGKPQAVNVARWSVDTLSAYNVYDSVLTAGNMVSIHHDTTNLTTGSGGTMYYDGALCENLTGNWNLYSSTPSGGPSDSGTQSGNRYIGQGFFTNDGWLVGDTDARTNLNGLLIGARKDTTDGTLDQYTGDMAEIRIYNRVLTTDEIAVVHRELAYKWGFSLQ
jgi:hypothetical protein